MTMGYTKALTVDTDPTFAGNSTTAVPSQSAVKTAIDLKSTALLNYTYATLPSAASNSGLHVWVTDVGVNGGSEWVSDGADWYPVNGEVILYRYGGIRLIAGAGNIVAGSSNTITQTTTWLPSSTMPHYVEVYLPAVASTPAVTAGWYTVEVTSSTRGTVLSAGIGSAPITFTVGAAISSVSTRQTLHTFTIPAGLMTAGSIIDTQATVRMAANANSRSVYVALNGTDCITTTYTSTTHVSILEWRNHIQSQGLDKQTSTLSSFPSDLDFDNTATTVDNTSAVTYTFDLIKATTNNRVMASDVIVSFRK